jgi:hypothetical protein
MALSTLPRSDQGSVQAQSGQGAGQKRYFIDVSGNRVLPIRIEYVDELPVVNRKATVLLFNVYTGLSEYVSPRTGRKYIVAEKAWRDTSIAPQGALVRFSYKTGSRSYIDHEYYQWFVVDEGVYDYVLKDSKGGKNVRVKLVNLRPVGDGLDDKTFAEIKAEIMNKGYLPSEFDPVETLYYYWIKQRVHEKPVAEEEEATAVEEEEETPEKQVELPPLPEPPKIKLEVEPASATAEATAMAPSIQQPQRQELVKIYLLSMRLPSRYLVQQVKFEEGREIRSWEGVAAEVASKLEGIRREAYDMINRAFAHVEDYGVWVAVTDEAVKEAEKVSEFVREKLKSLPLSQVKSVDIDKLYSVKAIPIYMEPEDARELLETAVKHLSKDVEELEAKIKEAESQKKRKYLTQLEKDLNYKRALLEAFKKYLDTIK